ncbi:AbrB/MazE/SpoVT family DNA-binding domain-containing protein [Pseudolysobacter antarcticus]|uniref:AbrB/MazE/SpoVT family DNA-binding domain-containing protein n=1 Tax=Pseudolysobacter antarcticus TaxID=2511995 RepID=A0A411HFU9_9GAMM|nr:AbrB/MazE/SpoVT family DNA-binding domain-containing protein [Pseudolysobacter antarcticus]QBB69362.1 AbrB/MazE/SpoVT family DNA-binding domain-containing protein [Pseudolysobacter antarcticus]
MVYELKLRKVGNSVGVILPKEVLAHLKVAEGDSLSVTEGPDDSLRVSLSRTEVTRQMDVVQDVMKRYRHTLRELAK